MTDPVNLRPAGEADLVALLDLERAAGLVAHREVFPPDRFDYPSEDVLARWRIVLEDPDVVVEVADLPGSGPDLLALVAYDPGTLRHLAVHPDHWGRGIASALVERVVRQQRASGASEVTLWVLAANARARALYERHGWERSGAQQESPWPPYPTELGYRRVLDDGATDPTPEEVSR